MMFLAWMVGVIDSFMLLFTIFSDKSDATMRLLSMIIFIPSILLALKVMGWI